MPLELTGSLFLSGSIIATNEIVAPYVSLPYKEYVGNFTQLSTSNPVVNVRNNTFGETVTWVRDSAGQYSATLASSNPKLIVITTSYIAPNADKWAISFADGLSVIRVYVRKISDNNFADLNAADGFTIEFRSYP